VGLGREELKKMFLETYTGGVQSRERDRRNDD
jgi:hypothetical protein